MENLVSKKNLPNFLYLMVTAVYLAATLFLQEGVALFEPYVAPGMTNNEFFLTLSLVLFLFGIVLYLSIRFYKIRINWVILGFCLLMFFTNMIGLLCFKGVTLESGSYFLSDSLRLRFILSWSTACLAFYYLLSIMPKTAINSSEWNIYFLGALIVSIIASVYSFATEIGKYALFFDDSVSFSEFSNNAPMSFANNRNTFGVLLLIGEAAALYLYVKTRRWPYIPLAVLLFFNIFIIMSKTALVCGLFLLLYFLVYEAIFLFKKHRKRSIVLFCLIGLFLLSPLFVHLISVLSRSPFWGKLDAYVSYFFRFILGRGFDDRITDTDTMKERHLIWNSLFSLISADPAAMIFGLGEWNFNWALGFKATNGQPLVQGYVHSGYLDVLGRFGIIGCLVYAVLLAYFVFAIIDNLKHNRQGSLFSLAIFVATLLHAFAEDTNFLNLQSKDGILFFMSYLPVLTDYYYDHHANEEYTVSEQTQKPSKINPVSVLGWFRLLSFIAATAAIVFLGFVAYYRSAGYPFMATPYFEGQLIVLFLVFPWLSFLFIPKDHVKNLYRYLVLAFASIYIVASFIMSFWFFNAVSFVIIAVLGVVYLILICFLTHDSTMMKALLSEALYILLSLAFISLCNALTQFMVLEVSPLSPFSILVMALFSVFGLLFLVAMPFARKELSGELPLHYSHFESFFYYGFGLYEAHNDKAVLRDMDSRFPVKTSEAQ
jgi:hypothetical protein